MNKPKVSICVPTYGQTNYLYETLKSIKSQDFMDYEIIISDDTPDMSVMELVTSFGIDKRLRYYHNSEILGTPANWNAAVSRAKGAYIKIMHHDDRFIDNGSLKAFVELLDDNPDASIAFSATKAESTMHGRGRFNRPSDNTVAEVRKNPCKLFFGNIIGAPSATIYRNGINVEYNIALKWLVDVDFYIRVLLQNKNIAYTSRVLVCVTCNAKHQVTQSCNNNAVIDIGEHLYLYEKIKPMICNEKNTRYCWFRLFEKYGVYSTRDLDRIGLDKLLNKLLLSVFFDDYHKIWLQRLPFRFYYSAPAPIRRMITLLFSKFK